MMYVCMYVGMHSTIATYTHTYIFQELIPWDIIMNPLLIDEIISDLGIQEPYMYTYI
jgi:hypothetical protein